MKKVKLLAIALIFSAVALAADFPGYPGSWLPDRETFIPSEWVKNIGDPGTDPTPISDGALVLMVLAGIYSVAKFSRKRRA